MSSDQRESQTSLLSGESKFQKQIESVKFSEDKFQRLIAEVEDYAILLLESDGTIGSWNLGAEKMKGYTASEIIGKNFRLFHSQEDRDARLPDILLENARLNGKSQHEGWKLRKDGSRFWGNVVITAVHNEVGDVCGFVKVTCDLTERKAAEDKFSNYAEQLRVRYEELLRSEQRYHKMISEVQEYAIVLLDKEGRVLDWNKGAEKLKGYSANEIIGKSFRMFYSKEDKDSGLPESILGVARKAGSAYHEGWRIRKDGTRFWANVSITTLQNDQGEIIGFSKVTRDLTERKNTEDRLSNIAEELRQNNEYLRQSEERYHRMIAEVEDYAIILLDRSGFIENWNTGAEKIKGYSASEIIGKSFQIFYTNEDRASGLPERLLNEAAQNGKAIHEGWRIRKDGSRFWGSVVITALHSNQGNVIGYSKVTRDLTERKKDEENLRTNAAQLDLKNKTLERLNNELSSFAFIASHDLKEPLRKIQMYASRLDALEDVPGKAREYVEKIRNGASRMQILIEDLLSYSQVTDDLGQSGVIDLNTVFSEVRTDLDFALTEKGALLESDTLPKIEGIAFQFHQLFLNLITNSLKFSKADETPRIEVRYETLEGPVIPASLPGTVNKYHHIAIRDNGIGFEPQHADKIFDIFHRLHSKDTFSGTGIGLAIVKKVVENHNGVIVAEGNPGVGAVFHIYLPWTIIKEAR